MALVSRSGFLPALSNLRLDFALRHRPRLVRAPLVTIFYPLFSACNSHHNSATVVTKSFTPVILFNSDGAQKVSRVKGKALDRLCDALF